MKRARRALLVLTTTVVGTMAVAGCVRGPEPHRLEAQLRSELPIGTPSSQVDAYLTAQGWQHSFLPDERSYLAGIRNVGSRFSLTREDLAIRSDFDKSGRLTAISAYSRRVSFSNALLRGMTVN